MNIEELNKTQIILLTLLVSFVTSIATGIVTVSLVNQAPPKVTDTIHKVIEKTVEKVVPSEQVATIIENTTTVVVKEESFIMEAIEKNSSSLMRIYSEAEAEEGFEFIALGFVLTEDGQIVTSKNNFIDEEGEMIEREYFINIDGSHLSLTSQNSESNMLLFKTNTPEESEVIFSPVVLGDSGTLKLGQTIVAMGGEKSNIVLTGIVSNLIRDKVAIEETEALEPDQEVDYEIITTQIDTNLNSQALMKLLINLDGEVVGVKGNSPYYTPINLISESLKKLSEEKPIAKE